MSSSPDFRGWLVPGDLSSVCRPGRRGKFPVASAPVGLAARLGSDESGTVAIEYGMIAAFIVIAIFVGVTNLGAVVTAMWTAVAAIF